jgi:hypothetical protein
MNIEETTRRWIAIVEMLQRAVNDIAWNECCETDGYCSQKIMHAIIHVNQARDELKQAIEILKGKYKYEDLPVSSGKNK